jgi:hypothetical protein
MRARAASARGGLHAAVLCALSCTLLAGAARAQGFSPHQSWYATKLPEPLLGESITDLDGTKAGEFELDVTALSLFSKGSRPGSQRASAELEWRITERFGLGVEAGGSREGDPVELTPSLSLGVSYAFFHDLARDLHLMAEVRAKLLEENESGISLAVADPSEPGRRVMAGLRGGGRYGLLTVRGAAALEAGGASAHTVPLRLELAALGSFGPGGTWGFGGLELIADWTRPGILVWAPMLLLDGAWLGLPVKLAASVPLQRDEGIWRYSGMVRVLFELDND